MKTSSMNISIPEGLRGWVEDLVSRQGYGTVSEYVRELIRNDQKRRAADALDATLVEAITSGSVEIGAEDFEAIRKKLRTR
jgi:antitoxin ParD1/3/4